MKTIALSIAATLLGALLTPAVIAAPPGGLPADPNPREPDFGYFEGRVKQINPHNGPDGRHFTWSYHTVQGTTMAYCQQQLTTWVQNGGVVVEDCVRVF